MARAQSGGIKDMAFDGFSDQKMTRKAMKAELLDAETELALAYAWRDQRDEQALHRLITAYMRLWWIKASIQDYVMRNWSMVRTGSTSSQKSLFFNMRRVQARLEREAAAEGRELDRHDMREMIAIMLR